MRDPIPVHPETERELLRLLELIQTPQYDDCAVALAIDFVEWYEFLAANPDRGVRAHRQFAMPGVGICHVTFFPTQDNRRVFAAALLERQSHIRRYERYTLVALSLSENQTDGFDEVKKLAIQRVGGFMPHRQQPWVLKR